MTQILRHPAPEVDRMLQVQKTEHSNIKKIKMQQTDRETHQTDSGRKRLLYI